MSLSKYIQDYMKEEGVEQIYTAPKAFLYQMYFVIAKLDESKLSRMDYLVNFGVSLENIHIILDLME